MQQGPRIRPSVVSRSHTEKYLPSGMYNACANFNSAITISSINQSPSSRLQTTLLLCSTLNSMGLQHKSLPAMSVQLVGMLQPACIVITYQEFPAKSWDPKVQVPFKIESGSTPRNVEIERCANTYTHTHLKMYHCVTT